MNKRWRVSIFTTVLVLIGVLSLVYSSRALADLLFQSVPGEGLRTQIILRPNLVLGPDTATLETDLLDVRQVVARRLDQLDLPGPYYLVNQQNQLAVTLPETEKMPYVISIITHVGKVEFIDGGAESPPLGQKVNTGQQADPGQDVYRVLFTGQDIETVAPPDSAAGQIFYRLTLNSAAVERFADFAETQPGHYVCMVLDSEVINCSVMYYRADNTLDILPNLGSGTAISLADLAVFLESGPLPLPVKVER